MACGVPCARLNTRHAIRKSIWICNCSCVERFGSVASRLPQVQAMLMCVSLTLHQLNQCGYFTIVGETRRYWALAESSLEGGCSVVLISTGLSSFAGEGFVCHSENVCVMRSEHTKPSTWNKLASSLTIELPHAIMLMGMMACACGDIVWLIIHSDSERWSVLVKYGKWAAPLHAACPFRWSLCLCNDWQCSSLFPMCKRVEMRRRDFQVFVVSNLFDRKFRHRNEQVFSIKHRVAV